MSDNGPSITVTRGKRTERARHTTPSSDHSRSLGWGLPGPGAVVSGVVRGVRTMWWAGLGAVATARDAGAQLFDALVEEGKSWEQMERKRREKRARQVRELTDESDAVRATEERIQEGVNAALRRLGVPSREEVDTLHEKMDALSDRIEHLARSVEEDDT